MDSTNRSAHRRVGAAAIAAFLALLLLGLSRGPASANPAAPAATPSAEPSQPVPDFGDGRDRDGRGPRGGFDGGGDPGGGPGFGGGDQDGGGGGAGSQHADHPERSEHRDHHDMTDTLHHVTRAALPVAIALLCFALAARAVLWAQLDHAAARRIASQYLEPLSTWCLIATGVYTLALGLRGDAELVAFVVPVVIGVAAVALRPAGEPSPGEPEPEPAAHATAPPASPVTSAPIPAGHLWSRHQ